MKHPDRKANEQEADAIAEAKLATLAPLVRAYGCRCAADYRFLVCRDHWHVQSVQIDHAAGCGINN